MKKSTFDQAIAALQEISDEIRLPSDGAPVVYADDSAGFDPAIILVIAQAVIEILKFIRERRAK